MARVGDVLAFTGGQERRDAHVNAGDRARRWERRRRDLYRDDDEPAGSASGTLTLHTDLSQDGALREVPMQPHRNVTHALDLELFGRGQELDPVPVPEVHTVEPGGGPKPWVPRRLADFHPPEERPERLIQAPQRLLLGGERPHPLVRADRPDLPELHHLRRRTDRHLSHPPSVPTFLQACVIQLRVRSTHQPESVMLFARRVQPKLERPLHTTDGNHLHRQETSPSVNAAGDSPPP